jgi:hypothetical protein
MNKHNIRLTQVGEKILRDLFDEKVVFKNDIYSIKTKKGMMEDRAKESLFWDWLFYVKSL